MHSNKRMSVQTPGTISMNTNDIVIQNTNLVLPDIKTGMLGTQDSQLKT